MEYLFLGVLGWIVLCSPALIFAAVANGRRRRENKELTQRITSLTKQLEVLDHRCDAIVRSIQAVSHPAPEVRILSETPAARPVATPTQPPAQPAAQPSAQPLVAQPVPPPPIPKPAAAPAAPIAPPHEAPKPPAPTVAPPPPPPRPPMVSPASAALPGMGIGAAAQPSPANISARVQAPATHPLHRGAVVAPSPVAPKKAASEGLEEKIGLKWFARIGIIIVVLGIALLIASKWTVIPLFVRVLLIYAGGLGILGLGIFAERYDNYRVLGRSLIGGGWATTFTITFAIGHAPSLLVLHSVTADLFLLLMVAAIMVWHTLKYDSQAVTGIAVLLGFASVTLNPDPPYNLIASVLLIAGMTVIVLKRQWFELAVLGILASYLTHLYCLYDKIIGPMGSHKTIFPQFYQIAALVLSYWVIFRVSYIFRKVSSRDQENISTVAALLNPLLLLAVLRYQSYQPKWGFTLLLALGAVEFILGQLSVSRRRTLPFYILSSLGATLMVAAVPLRYSGDTLAFLWLAVAELFLLAGIFTKEKLFRRFGCIISFLVSSSALPLRLAPLARQVMTSQPHHSTQVGLILAAIAAVLYANSHVIARVRADLFADELDKKALRLLSFISIVFAVGAIYSYVSDSAAAVALALFVVVISWLGRHFRIAELVYQAHWIAAVAFCDVVARGQLLETSWHAFPSRVLTFGLVAPPFYLSSPVL